MASTTTVTSESASDARQRVSRLPTIDILRGIVMVIMALDHTRDLFSNSAALFDPTDLAKTTPLLFFTRWITHFCAPIFVFLAGSSAFLSMAVGGKDRSALAKFLASRGLWLIFLEIFVISPFGWSFSFSFGFTRLQVIWVIGVSMLILAAFVLLLPSRLIGSLGILVIFTHDIFDGPHSAWLGNAAATWRVLHQVSFFQPLPHKIIASLYPLIPWVGVMMAGFGAGELFTLKEDRRRSLLLWIGAAATAMFAAVRFTNLYGDPSRWSVQTNPIFTLMSFVRCSKYPPSLLYLLMTLGPALIVLGLLSGTNHQLLAPFRVFGRVPLFYYLLHLPLLHGIAILLAETSYGSAGWLFQDFMNLRSSTHPLPAGYGYGLPVVYVVWLACVALLYPLCRWYGEVKKGRNAVIFRYL